MYWNSSEHWHEHRHRHHGNGWLVAVVIIGLIILTHGWILILPLMLLAGFVFVAFVLPKVMCSVNQNGWNHRDWNDPDHWQRWEDKIKRRFEDWDDRRYEEKPKRKNGDDIDYV